MVFYVFLCRSVCWILNGPFCHGALKLDICTLFTTFFIWTSLQFILKQNTTPYIKQDVTCMKTEVNLFSIQWA